MLLIRAFLIEILLKPEGGPLVETLIEESHIIGENAIVGLGNLVIQKNGCDGRPVVQSRLCIVSGNNLGAVMSKEESVNELEKCRVEKEHFEGSSMQIVDGSDGNNEDLRLKTLKQQTGENVLVSNFGGDEATESFGSVSLTIFPQNRSQWKKASRSSELDLTSSSPECSSSSLSSSKNRSPWKTSRKLTKPGLFTKSLKRPKEKKKEVSEPGFDAKDLQRCLIANVFSQWKSMEDDNNRSVIA
ncbi:hypothetical protein V6N11_076266 [Hibiscus sabdariffa]|uniref:Uncharacterized protein n=1 Tax=Hibiscus sabdariffa TaxID=183260 RepID=A0ABR2Q6B3_9ROSI